MSTIGKRIKEKRESAKLSQDQVADYFDIGKSAVSGWERGTSQPSYKKLEGLARVLHTSVDYLVSGKRDKSLASNNDLGDSLAIHNAEKIDVARRIPLISWISAGAWCESPDEFAPGDAEEWLPLPNNASEQSFALRVDGDSMTAKEPGAARSYPHGTIIYVDPNKQVTNGARVVARAPNGTYTFKTYFEDAGRMYLKAINSDYPPIDVTDNLHICGVVIGSYLPE